MKKTDIIIVVSLALLGYIVTAFSLWDFNPQMWPTSVRGFISTLWVIISAFMILINHNYKDF